MYSLMQFVKSVFEAFVELNALISSFERIIEMLRGMSERMKINGIKCDICDKMCNTDGLYDHLPQGWFTLEPGQGGGFVECKHFCSLECLRLWIPKHPVASEFVDEPETTKITLSDRVY